MKNSEIAEKIVATMFANSNLLFKRVKTLQDEGKNPLDDKQCCYDRAILIGQIEICDKLGIDRTQFNWIFSI